MTPANNGAPPTDQGTTGIPPADGDTSDEEYMDVAAQGALVFGEEGRARALGGRVDALVAWRFISQARMSVMLAMTTPTRPPGGRLGRGSDVCPDGT